MFKKAQCVVFKGLYWQDTHGKKKFYVHFYEDKVSKSKRLCDCHHSWCKQNAR